MTPARGSRGIGETYPPASPVENSPVPGDRNPRSSYPPGRSTHETPVQTHKSIDVTGDPGDRTAILTTRDVREEKTPASTTPYEHMCPHSRVCIFYAHEAEGQNQPPYHPDPPDLRCIWCPDQRDLPDNSQIPSPETVCLSPGEPEPVGPLAAQFLDRLAAQPDDPDLAARRRAVLDRLARPHTTRAKEQQP